MLKVQRPEIGSGELMCDISPTKISSTLSKSINSYQLKYTVIQYVKPGLRMAVLFAEIGESEKKSCCKEEHGNALKHEEIWYSTL